MSSPLQAMGRLAIYIAWNLIMVPAQVFAVRFLPRAAKRIPVVYHRNCLTAMGIATLVRGKAQGGGPTLYVANHSSYLDISVLGALLPVSFVAKAEIRDWPIYGVLARLQRSVFVDRRPQAARGHAEEIKKRLEAGDDLVLFPEGTSGDGNGVLPFKSALFAVAAIEIDGRPVRVQPITIAYTRLDGMPMGRHLRPYFTWYGDMDMMSHLWRMFGMGHVTVEVEFHDPVTIADFGSRKALSRHCEQVVAGGLSRALSGRGPAARRRRRLLRRGAGKAPRTGAAAGAAGGSTAGASAGPS